MVQETPLDDGMRLSPEERLPSMQRNFSALMARVLYRWCLRWAVGFALIWAVTNVTGRFDWLWPLGIVVAAITLTFTFGAQIMIRRKFHAVERAGG